MNSDESSPAQPALPAASYRVSLSPCANERFPNREELLSAHDGAASMGAMLEYPNTVSDRDALLDELARCFVQAAVTRLLIEQRNVDDGAQASAVSARQTPRVRRPRADPAT